MEIKDGAGRLRVLKIIQDFTRTVLELDGRSEAMDYFDSVDHLMIPIEKWITVIHTKVDAIHGCVSNEQTRLLSKSGLHLFG